MKSPMRIAQIVGKMKGGGVESVVMNYYRHIDTSRFQFDFIVDSDSTMVPKDEIEQLGGRIIEIPPYQKAVDYHKTLVSILKENNYKIVHSHINTLSVFSLFAALRAGVPVRIAHSHSTAGKGETAKNLMKYALRPFSKLFATHYCACSEYAGMWLFGNRTMNGGKVKVIRNAIALERFLYNPQVRTEVRNELGLTNEIVVGHVGRFMYQKNHKFLVEIFAELLKREPKAFLLLIGEGELQESIIKYVNELGIADNVKFLGQRADVHRLYQAMDVFLFPSHYEGLGMVCIEAQAAGLPCLASDAVPDEAKAMENMEFLSLNDTAKVWADELIKLVHNTKRENTFKQMQEAKFEITTAAQDMQDYYEDLAK